jgi:hypothetical protein
MTTELINAVDALNEVTQKHTQLNEKYQGTYDALANNTQAMTDWQTQQGTVELTDQQGNKHPTPTLKTLIEQAQSVNPHPHTMTKAQFDALRELRKQQYAGSGFVEWGKNNRSMSKVINEGMGAFGQTRLVLGPATHTPEGSSRTLTPECLIDGVKHKLSFIKTTSKIDNDIYFPPAPDGTKTYDSATGTVTQHANAEVAFAAETATNKVITSRKDLVFLESWHEKIADKDVVYPLGNVQYGASRYEGVTLLNNLVAQGYSAFGEWDENTKGYGAKWSSLTDAQKALFLSEPEHNIYFDPQANAYIQVRYRIRVVEGKGDDWYWKSPESAMVMRYSENPRDFVKYRGSSTNSDDYYLSITGYRVLYGNFRSDGASSGEPGLWCEGFSGVAYEGKAIPIALVQRMNQGAYHPSYNPMGCNQVGKSNDQFGVMWFSSDPNRLIITSQSDCFSKTPIDPRYGRIGGIGTGRSDQYSFYNTIYAGQVEDLRLNANKLDVNKLREDSIRKAVVGTLRGKGKVPFTKIGTGVVEEYTRLDSENSRLRIKDVVGININKADLGISPRPYYPNYNVHIKNGITDFVTNKAAFVNFGPTMFIYFNNAFEADFTVGDSVHIIDSENYLSPEFDSLPWVDIIGHPERIAATFPDGVVGQWIPEVHEDSSTIGLNKKSNVSVGNRVFTTDDGQSWTSSTATFEQIGNTVPVNSGANTVALINYETLSNFTEPSNNAVVVGDVDDVYYTTHSKSVCGNRLQGSLTGEIGKATANPAHVFVPNLGGYRIDNGQFSELSNYPVKTGEVPLAPQGNNSPAVKTLSTITEKNGLYYLQLHGAELRYDPQEITALSETSTIEKQTYQVFKLTDGPLKGRLIQRVSGATTTAINHQGYSIDNTGIRGSTNTQYNYVFLQDEHGWGDDQTIPIIDGENVKIDLNGNTVKVFCHHTQIPVGIAHND